jgi:dienelactone hydrolase
MRRMFTPTTHRTAFIAVSFLLASSLGGLVGCSSKASEAGAEASAASGAEAAPDIRAEEVSYSAGEVTLKGFLTYDAANPGPRPGVLVVHEWWGHNDYARQRARMLAELGYTALAVDMYGDGKTADHPDMAGKLSGEVFANIDEGVKRFEAARAFLASQPTTDPAHIAAIGYCFGGGVVLHMARIGMDLDLVASFHGMLGGPARAQPGGVKPALLVFNGEADPFIKPELVSAFKTEMQSAGAKLEFVSYPGALHGFTNPGATALGKQFGLPLAYDEAADKDSWQKLQTGLAAAFAQP